MLATPPDRLFFGLVPWYSVLIVAGICAALLYASREEKRLSLPADTVIDLALWVIPFGVAGAWFYYVLFAWETFAPDPLSILYVWKGGLAIYGGIIGGFAAVVLFARRRHIPLATLTDLIVPGLALAQAIGRWGNYFNMEAYGAEVVNPAWQFFPIAVLIPGHGGSTWHLATFFYESVWNLLVFSTLLFLRKRIRRTGDLTLWYTLLYGCGRLVIEGLRTDSLTTAGSTIRVSQLLSVCLCLTVLLLFIRFFHQDSFPWKKALIASGAASVAFLLPGPVEAFWSYGVCSLILVAIAAVSIVLHSGRIVSLLPLLSVLLFFVVRNLLASSGSTGLGASTLQCILFSVTALSAGGCLYARSAA